MTTMILLLIQMMAMILKANGDDVGDDAMAQRDEPDGVDDIDDDEDADIGDDVVDEDGDDDDYDSHDE